MAMSAVELGIRSPIVAGKVKISPEHLSRGVICSTRPIMYKGAEIGSTVVPHPIFMGADGMGGFMGRIHTEDGLRIGGIAQIAAGIDKKDVATDIGTRLGLNHFYTEAGDPAWNAFLDTHQLTVISTPNMFHLPHLQSIFSRDDAAFRFAYCEKPIANTEEQARLIALLERANPGRIGVVSQNMVWDQILELSNEVRQGNITNIFDGEYVYKQDWFNWGVGANWRAEREEGALPVSEGGIGKLLDILIHAIGTMRFTTGMRVKAVEFAKVHEIIKERSADASATYGEGDMGASAGMVKVGGDTRYHGDDALDAIVTLENGANIRIRIAQCKPGEKNSFYFNLSGFKNGEATTVSFDTDNPDLLTTSNLGNSKVIDARNPGNMSYMDNMADWIVQGLDINKKGIGWFTPVRHGQGWKEVHKRQMMAFALYCQRVHHGLQGPETRSDLFFVPTALENWYDMRAIKAIYEAATSGKRTEVSYDLAA